MKRLLEKVREKNSCVCVGLDPRIGVFPQEILSTGQSVEEMLVMFSKGIIESVAPHAAAIKPQIAFFEQYGLEGLRALKRICKMVREAGLFLLMDAKRGDIGTTAEAYAKAFFTPDGDFFSDALTVNGYLGSDGILPFLRAAEEVGGGVFVLVKTSNPSSAELQDLRVGADPLYERMADLLNAMDPPGSANALGAVVGATHPEELKRLRTLMPERMFLIPGFGAQGGKAEDIEGTFGADGSRAIINSSRGIIYAYKQWNLPWKEACEEAVKEMKEQINALR